MGAALGPGAHPHPHPTPTLALKTHRAPTSFSNLPSALPFPLKNHLPSLEKNHFYNQGRLELEKAVINLKGSQHSSRRCCWSEGDGPESPTPSPEWQP